MSRLLPLTKLIFFIIITICIFYSLRNVFHFNHSLMQFIQPPQQEPIAIVTTTSQGHSDETKHNTLDENDPNHNSQLQSFLLSQPDQNFVYNTNWTNVRYGTTFLFSFFLITLCLDITMQMAEDGIPQIFYCLQALINFSFLFSFCLLITTILILLL
jgi:hypothetical protein